MNITRIILVGAGGYGDTYVRALLLDKKRTDYVFAGVIDPYVKSAPGYEMLAEAGIPMYNALEDFFAADRADLAIIATPIPLHEPQALCALDHGCHVLLEKPIAATSESGRRIAAAANVRGLMLAIGFQWCYDDAMLRLKADIDSGLLGKPVDLRALVLWPRDFAYYARGTGWAGRKFAKNGDPIYDSIASNATAHYLENMLWLCGEGYNASAITEMTAEVWRANDIETYDTVTMRAKLDCGAQITYAASHAVDAGEIQNPMFEYRFEKGVARFGGAGRTGRGLTVEFADGSVKDYGPSYNGNQEKVWVLLDVLGGERPLPCPAEAALKHLDAIEMLRGIQPDAYIFKNARRDESHAWTPGLAERLMRCYREAIMLSEAGEEKA